MKYRELLSRPNFPELQTEILEFWKTDHTFEKSVKEKTDGEVVFYDGPPFPTGKPHHGTVLVSYIKDMIARYWTMKGYSIPRVWGWDCHGLPIENQAEVLLGIDDKNVIEKSLGIDKFNEKCYEIVSSNNEAWKEYVEQMARWVDYDGAYKTMNVDFMESVMWAFKTCYEKGLIYQDYRVTPYCWHCETSLSISDTRESDSTRPRQDRWVMAKFKTDLTVDGKPVNFIAWTTTPWTLPSNMALAVGPEIDYAYVVVDDQVYIACENTLPKYDKVFGKDPVIVKRCKGKELVGLSYYPLFDYFASKKEEGAFRVIEADFVDSEEGIGVVHIAPAFGEDDYWACKKNGVPLVNPVDAKGRFTPEITDFYHGEEEQKNVIESNAEVIRYLYEHKKAVADGTIEHNYPHCWRCKRPLIYKAMNAWYFNVDKIKDRLLELNEEINWVPDTVKHGRFGNWLQNARDWNISRNRYWSTPIPIWECDCCQKRVVLGSIAEIEEASGVKLTNLHRQYMDKVTFPCSCGGTMTRIPEVLDCWFESASVPFAQKHYPFENKEWFESHFPSDFIVEYTGQIRCWFYYLHVLAGALFDKPAFQNCIVHGTVLAKDGKKLSKSSKNYTDPMKLMKEYGTDAFRLYMYQSSAMLIGDLQFDESGLQDAIQQILLPLWNSCNFYISYANIDGFHPDTVKEPDSDNQLDQWILAKLYETQKSITENMDAYHVNRFMDSVASLIDGLTNWYIRRSRRRFWGSGVSVDKQNAYETLYYVLVNTCKLLAPVTPIIAEKLYQTLTEEESVHLAAWPQIPEQYANETLLKEVDLVQNVIYLARSLRNKNRVKNRQPLMTMKVAISNAEDAKSIEGFTDIIAEEINVKNVEILDQVSEIATINYAPNFNNIRGRYPDRIPAIIKAVKTGAFEFSADGSKVILDMNGTKSELEADIILVTYQAKNGLHVVSDRGVVVLLDLTITEELRREGIAREIIRNIQDGRKQSGCDIMDHIWIQCSGDVPEEWMEYICKETLAEVHTFDEPSFVCEMQGDNDNTIRVEVKKIQ